MQASFVAKTREAIGDFLELIERHREPLHGSAAISLKAWAERIMDETGYYAELRRAEKSAEASENRVRNLRELIATLSEAAVNPAEELQKFLDDLALDSDRDDEEEAPKDAVTLITVHSCKGLEFPHVYIVGLEDGLMPHTRSKVEGTLDEERRLFYVAITRAMQTLTLTHCAGRRKKIWRAPALPSLTVPARTPRRPPGNRHDEKSRKPVSAETSKDYFSAMRLAAGAEELKRGTIIDQLLLR